jgi:hypothetical protein
MATFLRSLAVLAAFQSTALLVLTASGRGRGRWALVAVGVALVVLVAARALPVDLALLLASAALSAWAIERTVRARRGLIVVASAGLLPVLTATAIGWLSSDPIGTWNDLRAQVETMAGVTPRDSIAVAPEDAILREKQQRLAKQAANWTLRLLPAELFAFYLLQVLVMVVVAGRLAARRGVQVMVLPASSWRVPFASVWCLAIGLGFLAVRHSTAVTIGANLACVATALLAVQGAAVLLAASERGFGRAARWLVLGLFVLTALPFVMVLAALIGLADQWVDFRRLRLAGSDS